MKHLIAAIVVLPFFFTACGNAQAVEEKALQERIEKSSSQHGWLGVSTQDMTRRLARSMDVKTEKGALVNDVVEDSPAEKAGIEEEDIIVEFNGKPIDDADELVQAVRREKPEAKATIVVMRKDERKTLTATLDKAPRSRTFSITIPPIPKIPGHPFHRDRLGLTLMQLDGQLGEYFEAPDGKGVLVKNVKPKSNAEKAGFKAGDVIVSIGKKPITRVEDVRRALRKYDEDEKADCEVVRKGKRVTLSVQVPEMDDSHGFFYRYEPHGELMEDFDFDGGNLEELEHLEIERHDLDREMDALKQDLKELGLTIRDNVIKLRDELRLKLREVTNS